MVIIGTSFIGMEVASFLSDKAKVVECVDIAAVPFERVLGARIGLALQQVGGEGRRRDEREREREIGIRDERGEGRLGMRGRS